MSEAKRWRKDQTDRPRGAANEKGADPAREHQRKRERDQHLGVNRTSEAARKDNPGNPH
jgi:hypothetical protein